jgi:hypothetical protein
VFDNEFLITTDEMTLECPICKKPISVDLPERGAFDEATFPLRYSFTIRGVLLDPTLVFFINVQQCSGSQ